jgi:hypothetical protein
MLLCPWALAQVKDPVLLGTMGYSHSNSGYFISYSVGELSVSPEFSGNFLLTQGFQQFFLDSAPIVIPPCESGDCPEIIKAFPNPIREKLSIQFYKVGINDFTVEIFNSKGCKVYQIKYKEVTYGARFEFDFGNLPKELYLINISSDDGKLLERFKIIKI